MIHCVVISDDEDINNSNRDRDDGDFAYEIPSSEQTSVGLVKIVKEGRYERVTLPATPSRWCFGSLPDLFIGADSEDVESS